MEMNHRHKPQKNAFLKGSKIMGMKRGLKYYLWKDEQFLFRKTLNFLGKFYFETKVLTFFGKRTSLSFYEKCFFFNVKSIKNVLILRKKSSENKSLFFF